MRHLVFAFVAFVLAVAGCVHSQPGDAPDFAALEQRWMDALSEKKLAELEELLASDFTIVGAGSSADDPIGDRAGWLANARRFPWPRHQVRVLQTRRLGETAIVHASGS